MWSFLTCLVGFCSSSHSRACGKDPPTALRPLTIFLVSCFPRSIHSYLCRQVIDQTLVSVLIHFFPEGPSLRCIPVLPQLSSVLSPSITQHLYAPPSRVISCKSLKLSQVPITWHCLHSRSAVGTSVFVSVGDQGVCPAAQSLHPSTPHSAEAPVPSSLRSLPYRIPQLAPWSFTFPRSSTFFLKARSFDTFPLSHRFKKPLSMIFP